MLINSLTKITKLRQKNTTSSKTKLTGKLLLHPNIKHVLKNALKNNIKPPSNDNQITFPFLQN